VRSGVLWLTAAKAPRYKKRELEKLITDLTDKQLEDLDERERRRLEAVLYQPSDKGRVNYMAKLLEHLQEQKDDREQWSTPSS
jgi:uncharacterized protein YbgA (DUF1722 family)